MPATVISIRDLSKHYRLGVIGSGTLREDLNSWWRRVKSRKCTFAGPALQNDGARDREMWALRHVDLDVEEGEILGIVGRNGAGKSTLLKILSRITAPTTGRVIIRGRVGSLLEVGTGFHPELTGRENIYLNGALLGMSKVEVTRKLDEIIEFAEVSRFVDTPVKRYSSGMYVRLAFAVAAHLEPEILIVDEVLAVGDAAFQRKCLGKIADVSKHGRTVLFVSHNMVSIKSLCSRAICLNDGIVAMNGEVEQVVDEYLNTGAKEVLERSWDDPGKAPGNQKIRIKAAKLVRDLERAVTVSESFRIRFEIYTLKAITLNVSAQLDRLGGETVFATPSEKLNCDKGVATFECHVPGDFMNDGHYSVDLMVVENDKSIFVLKDCLRFLVVDTNRAGSWYGRWPGAVRPRLKWDCAYMSKGNLGRTKAS